MPMLPRRDFLTMSLGGLGAALACGSRLFADETAELNPSPESAQLSNGLGTRPGPDSLFLTWRRDPTTPMMIQWVGPETQEDTTIAYVPLDGEVWATAKTATKPYPNTDLKVHRCELSGLKAGTEYMFQVGKNSPVYRFRT